jgi:hypothetical protein
VVEETILKELRRVALGAWRPEPGADSHEVKRLAKSTIG